MFLPVARILSFLNFWISILPDVCRHHNFDSERIFEWIQIILRVSAVRHCFYSSFTIWIFNYGSVLIRNFKTHAFRKRWTSRKFFIVKNLRLFKVEKNIYIFGNEIVQMNVNIFLVVIWEENSFPNRLMKILFLKTWIKLY